MGGLFALKSRRLLTTHIQIRYIQSKVMYTCLNNHKDMDNPDQRITQDIDKFSETLRQIVSNLIIAPLMVIYYTWQCWAVSGFIGPFLIYVYFILGSFISRRLIQPIVNAVFYKELQEGNFRWDEYQESNLISSDLTRLSQIFTCQTQTVLWIYCLLWGWKRRVREGGEEFR